VLSLWLLLLAWTKRAPRRHKLVSCSSRPQMTRIFALSTRVPVLSHPFVHRRRSRTDQDGMPRAGAQTRASYMSCTKRPKGGSTIGYTMDASCSPRPSCHTSHLPRRRHTLADIIKTRTRVRSCTRPRCTRLGCDTEWNKEIPGGGLLVTPTCSNLLRAPFPLSASQPALAPSHPPSLSPSLT
jgi:hypothetical protein